MEVLEFAFNEHHVLHELKHYLPAQAPLKDFVHHNTLHAFQHLKFHKGLQCASEIFGYRTSLSIKEFRDLFAAGRIKEPIIDRAIAKLKPGENLTDWKHLLFDKHFDKPAMPRIGGLRSQWKRHFKIDLDSLVHPTLFRVLCSYLDQGISIWAFPVSQKGFLSSLRELEQNSYSSFFRTKKVRNLLLHSKCHMEDLLKELVGDERYFMHYLFDQQFAHPGWSGIVSVIEDQPETLLDSKKISLHDLIIFELLLEMDALESYFGGKRVSLCQRMGTVIEPLFAEVKDNELADVVRIWQTAFEWSYYDEVLSGIAHNPNLKSHTTGEIKKEKSFQAFFCIDDRECSIRRWLEHADPDCATYATPGFFSVEFYYQPDGGKFYTKLCPAPVTPKYLIKEISSPNKLRQDVHFTKRTHGLSQGWLISQTLGFWSAIRLFINIFKPSMSPATASSFRHMEKVSTLQIDNTDPTHIENGLQVGFTDVEMVNRVESVLKSTGLVDHFAPLVYIVGHGASSTNNPHYAAYDCGACCGRPGSVNARVFSYMANKPEVRALLQQRGIHIPDTTQFIGALHDTSSDEIQFFDEDLLQPANAILHTENEVVFKNALDLNAKERSRRFESINTIQDIEKVHDKIKLRPLSLFEPRPELNHATNTLCIVGRRELTQNLFLDRRAFMNSYNYEIDPDGHFLFGILKAAAPVCGGINLEYYFSRVDNQKLGAGTKLPHNVMGLFGVANGIDGDLRPGLPSQMIEIHDPLRLLIIVEHFPEVVLKTIQKSPETYEWFINEWVELVVMHPIEKTFHSFNDGAFEPYHCLSQSVKQTTDLMPILEHELDNLPVYQIN